MIDLIKQHREEIIALCKRYRLKSLELFGSAASGEFDPATSDVDFFYSFDPNDLEGLEDRYFEFHESLEKLFGRKVDLVSSRYAKNPYFLKVANQHRLSLYAA
ncbi:MAG TPA: nucleotidyltransferase domain-containing protein [Tepidisphaeraceae bacterium]|jgi:hypothetical protein